MKPLTRNPVPCWAYQPHSLLYFAFPLEFESSISICPLVSGCCVSCTCHIFVKHDFVCWPEVQVKPVCGLIGVVTVALGGHCCSLYHAQSCLPPWSQCSCDHVQSFGSLRGTGSSHWAPLFLNWEQFASIFTSTFMFGNSSWNGFGAQSPG